MTNRTRILLKTLALLLLSVGAVSAQTPADPFAWEAGDMAFFYPLNWDIPHPFTDEQGRPAIQLAQVSAAEPQVRPPAAQVIRITILDGVEDNAFAETLAVALSAQETPANGELTDGLIGGNTGLSLVGTSADNTFAGVARIARVGDGRVVLMTGRTLVGTLETFLPIFDEVASTIAPGAGDIAIRPGYAVQWQTSGSGDVQFGPIRAMAGGPNNQLYALDADNGLLIIDANTGALIEARDNDFLAGSVDIAVDGQGSMLLANPACRCLAAFAPNGAQLWVVDNFAEDKPTQVTNASGVVYADDRDDRGAFARTIGSSRQSVRTVEPIDRFWLATDRSNQPIVLTPDGVVLTTQNGLLTELTRLEGLPDVRAIDVDRDDNLVLAASDAGVFLLDDEGNVSDRLAAIVAGAPLPGEVVAPSALAVLANGSVVFADVDGNSSTITAVSRRALPVQTGSSVLEINVPVQGLMTETSTEERWTFTANTGDEVTLSAVELSRAGTLDVSLQLLGPDGSEVASNEDQLGLELWGVLDAQISAFVLPQTGRYTAIVTRVAGTGIYGLGYTALRPLPDDGEVTRIESTLSDAIPAHYWLLDGQAGEVLTITMETTDGSLDPLLRLYGPNGRLVTWNDDAADTDLGTTAQIVLVELPDDGTYRLDATRFDGAGSYSMVIVEMSGD
jgi:outer membrane protein assembly factor BamB